MLSGLMAGYIRKEYSMTYGIWSSHGEFLDILLKTKKKYRTCNKMNGYTDG